MEYSQQGTTAASRYETLVSDRSTYDREAKESLKYINHKNFADVLKSDKKTIGSILKLAIPEDYGKISFKNFDLNAKSNIKIAQAINKIL